MWLKISLGQKGARNRWSYNKIQQKNRRNKIENVSRQNGCDWIVWN